MKRVILLFALACVCFAQSDSPIVTTSLGLPNLGYQQILVYSGGLLGYVCYAASTQNTQTVAVSAASNANPVSFTATAHGFDYQSGATALPSVRITGGTGNWTAINGIWVATPTSANAFTIPVNSTAFGALTGTLVVTTRAPLTTSSAWAIQHLVYDGSSNLVSTGWASDTSKSDLQGGSPAFRFACASRANYSYQ